MLQELLGLFGYEETTKLAMLTLWGWIKRYGIPSSLYVDHKNVFITKREPTLKEQLSGKLPVTQFGKACQKLGIKIIPASSPQAKGRVERSNGICQDRLIKELRLANINEMDKANEFTKNIYFDNSNRKFAISPREDANYHRSVVPGIDLNAIFCLQEQRTINNDWTIRYHNRFFQIKRQSKILPPAKKKVTVCEYLDGSIHIVYRNYEVSFEEIFCPLQKQQDRFPEGYPSQQIAYKVKQH